MSETTNPFANFARVLNRADDALQDERRDAQWHLEQLVGAGWELTDHIDTIRAKDVGTLAEVIDQVSVDPITGGSVALAQVIVDEWGLLFNYERVVAAAKALGAHPDFAGHGATRELHAALAPFRED